MGLLTKEIGGTSVWTAKELGQLRPADTTAASLYSPPSGIIVVELEKLVICNTTGSAATYRIFIDQDGSTYDQTSALYYDVSLAANTSALRDLRGTYMNNSSGNIGVRTGTNDALNFTVYGVEVKSQ